MVITLTEHRIVMTVRVGKARFRKFEDLGKSPVKLFRIFQR